MVSLLYKEYLTNRITLIFCIVISLLYNFKILAEGPPIPLVTLIAMFYTFTVAGQEDKNNSHVFINSLPVTRNQVVAVKYLFTVLVGLLLIGMTAVIQWALSEFSPASGIVEILYAICAVCFFAAVFYPLYFWLGAQFVRIGIFAFFMVVFGVSPIIANIMAKKNCWGILGFILSMPAYQRAALALSAAVAVMVISQLLSMRIYGRKDF